jgi:hypothetical protein
MCGDEKNPKIKRLPGVAAALLYIPIYSIYFSFTYFLPASVQHLYVDGVGRDAFYC